MYNSARSADAAGVMGDSYAIHQVLLKAAPCPPSFLMFFIDEQVPSIVPLDGVVSAPHHQPHDDTAAWPAAGAIGYADDIAAATAARGMMSRLRCAELHGRMSV
jgi:hypothetical protein